MVNETCGIPPQKIRRVGRYGLLRWFAKPVPFVRGDQGSNPWLSVHFEKMMISKKDMWISIITSAIILSSVVAVAHNTWKFHKQLENIKTQERIYAQ